MDQPQAWSRNRKVIPTSCTRPGQRINARSTLVQRIAYRRRWIMLVQDVNGACSKIGEIWFVEAESPTGPWRNGRKIVTHDRSSFYEVVHDPALDEDAYSGFLAGAPNITPRCDYNVLSIAWTLSDPRSRFAPLEEFLLPELFSAAGRPRSHPRVLGTALAQSASTHTRPSVAT